MTPEMRKNLILFLQSQLDIKLQALDLYSKFPKQLTDLEAFSLVIPAQERADELSNLVNKLKKQIELLKDSAVEGMSDAEFAEYINQ